MKQLNDLNGASHHTTNCAQKILKEFSGPIYGAEMGVAYGGGIETIGKLWYGRGIVWGFDTFEGHPKQLADACEYTKEAGGVDSHAACCMDPWYADQENFGTEKYKYEYIRKQLDKQHLHNVILVKGLITEQTRINFIPKLHYCLIDLDFPIAMWNVYNVVKDKIISGGYLCMHDVVPQGHIHGCYEYYQKILEDMIWDIEVEDPDSLLVVLRKK